MIGVEEACLRAKEHAGAIAHMNEADRNAVLTAAARALREHAPQIIAENRKDCEACTRGAQFVDRLMLDEKRIDGIAVGLEKLVSLACPVGEVLEERTLYNGLRLRRRRSRFALRSSLRQGRRGRERLHGPWPEQGGRRAQHRQRRAQDDGRRFARTALFSPAQLFSRAFGRALGSF